MAWYWIVLIVIGYLVIGSVLAGVMTWVSYDFDDEELFPVIILLWPIIVPFLLLWAMCLAILDSFR